MVAYENRSLDTSVVWVLFLYFVAISLTGLFGLSSGSIGYLIVQVVSFVLLSFYVIYGIGKGRVSRPRLGRGMRFSFVYIGLLIFSAFGVILFASRDEYSVMSMAQFFLPILLGIILLVVLSGVGFSRNDVNLLLKRVVAFLVFSSIYNVIVNFGNILTLTSISNSYDLNFMGFFANRNVFGYLMAVGVSLSVYLWSIEKRRRYLWFALIIGVSLVLTMSRGSIVFASIFTILFFILNSKAKLVSLFGLAIFAIPASLIILSQPFVQDNFVRSENSDTGRTELRVFGMDTFFDNNIIFGSGQKAISLIEEKFTHSSFHNLYVETLVTQGILGAVTLILLLIFSFYQAMLIVKLGEKKIGNFFLAFFVAFIVYAYIEALPLFYGTPGSIITTYILIILPMFMLNKISLNQQGRRMI